VIKFDRTINAGNLLQFGALLVTAAVAFSILDRRISVLEDRDARAAIAASERQVEQKEALRDIKDDIKDLQRSVNEIGKAVATRTQGAQR